MSWLDKANPKFTQTINIGDPVNVSQQYQNLPFLQISNLKFLIFYVWRTPFPQDIEQTKILDRSIFVNIYGC